MVESQISTSTLASGAAVVESLTVPTSGRRRGAMGFAPVRQPEVFNWPGPWLARARGAPARTLTAARLLAG